MDWVAVGGTALVVPVFLTLAHSTYKNYVDLERYNEVQRINKGRYEFWSNLFNSLVMTATGSSEGMFPIVGATNGEGDSNSVAVKDGEGANEAESKTE